MTRISANTGSFAGRGHHPIIVWEVVVSGGTCRRSEENTYRATLAPRASASHAAMDNAPLAPAAAEDSDSSGEETEIVLVPSGNIKKNWRLFIWKNKVFERKVLQGATASITSLNVKWNEKCLKILNLNWMYLFTYLKLQIRSNNRQSAGPMGLLVLFVRYAYNRPKWPDRGTRYYEINFN